MSIGYKINLLALTCLASLSSQAQTPVKVNGIYLQASDFKRQQVKEELGAGDQLKTNSFFAGSQVKLQRGGKTSTMAKADLYGYRMKDKDYRFFNNGEYLIADTAGFYLYKREQLTAGRKGQVPHTVYYFSKSAASPLLKLTIGNLNRAYEQQTDFRYALMDYFKTDAQLSSYDPQLKTYQVKHIYAQHNKSVLSR